MSIPWREQWLSELARSMEVLFGADDKFREKAYRVTCGWPSKHATGTRKVRVGGWSEARGRKILKIRDPSPFFRAKKSFVDYSGVGWSFSFFFLLVVVNSN
jgi:hypothetical protein